MEQGTFTPLVFMTMGEMGKECLRFHCRLLVAELIASQKEEQYSTAISWVTAQVSFVLLQSALFSLRGSRNIKKIQRDIKNNDIDIDIFEGAIHFHKLEDKTLLNSVMYSPKLSQK